MSPIDLELLETLVRPDGSSDAGGRAGITAAVAGEEQAAQRDACVPGGAATANLPSAPSVR